MKKTKRQKTELGYKVVRVRDRRNYSCTGSSNKRCVRYPLNGWVYPFDNCGPLAVFHTLKWAKEFIKQFPSMFDGGELFKIYMCRYIPSKGSCLFIGSRSFGNSRDLFHLPNGTRLARSVKIIKKCYETKKKVKKVNNN